MSKRYPSSLTDEQWAKIAAYFSPAAPRGRKAVHSKKEIVDAMLYVLKGGIQWKMFPSDFTPWKTVYDHFSRWNKRGVWAKVLSELNRERRQREKKSAPSYGIIDSQSTKAIYASEERGIDGCKKVKGRKRHIVVDTLGNLLHVFANLLPSQIVPRLADQGQYIASESTFYRVLRQAKQLAHRRPQRAILLPVRLFGFVQPKNRGLADV